MSKRGRIISFVLLGIIVLCGIVWAGYFMNKRNQAEAILDEKCEIVKDYYGMSRNFVIINIVDRFGGYDASSGRYHYEFTIEYYAQPYAIIIYDGVEDLTEATAHRLVAERP